MSHLYEVLARRVDTWRAAGHPVEDFPALGFDSGPDMLGEEVLTTHPLPAGGA